MENKTLLRLINKLSRETDIIDEKRKSLLRLTAELIKDEIESKGSANITFICTHNSRRSQLGEAWLVAASEFYKVEKINAFSGGTEETSFNIRMVVALREAGFHLHSEGPIQNPKYTLYSLKERRSPHIMYSKKFDDEFNPAKHFFALMVCDHADQNCPLVLGATHRISLPYLDPKEFDDTPMESLEYSEKVKEIGREILYLVSEIKM